MVGLFSFVFFSIYAKYSSKISAARGLLSNGSSAINSRFVLDPENSCKIPNLDAFNPEIRQFIKTSPTQDCSVDNLGNWVFVKNGKIFLSEEAKRKYGNISCQFTDFRFKTDFENLENGYNDSSDGAKLLGDFFHANCKAKSNSGFLFAKAYSNIHMSILPSISAISRARKSVVEAPAHIPHLNVYIFALESTSRMNAIRKLPKLYKFVTEDLQGVFMEGYNIVGDGTPQAFIPILTGKTEEELPLARKRFPEANFVDDVYPLIWNDYKNAGYVTLFGDDTWTFGMFQYRLKGFSGPPTDHYLRPFTRNVPEPTIFNNGYCVGQEPRHIAHFRTAYEFFRNYPMDIRKFALLFFGQDLSHQDINRIGLADQDFADHLRLMRDSGFLNQTILIVMADHGIRYADLRATQQGQLEERMPLMGFAAPEWFRRGHATAWKNLRENAKRLTTPFDIFESLKVSPTMQYLLVSLYLWHVPYMQQSPTEVTEYSRLSAFARRGQTLVI